MDFLSRPKRIPALQAWEARVVNPRSAGDEGFLIKGIVMCATEKAILLRSPHVSEIEEWIPLSQLLDCDQPPEEGKTVIFTLTTWLAEQKGWV